MRNIRNCIFIFFTLLLAAPAVAQLDQGAPVSSLEYELVRGMTDSVIVLVRQEYNLRSGDQEYVLGDADHFGQAYSLGVFAEGKIWLTDAALTPWVGDPTYAPYTNRDSLVPVLKNTYIRPLHDSVFHQITVAQVDTFPGEVAGLAVTNYPCKLALAKQDTVAEGWAVVVYPAGKLDSVETCPLKVNVLYNQARLNPQTGEIKLSSGTAVLNAMGGAFFTSEVRTGQLQLRFAGLLKRKLLGFEVLPVPGQQAAAVPPPPPATSNERTPEPPPPPPPPRGNNLRSLNPPTDGTAAPAEASEAEEVPKCKRKKKGKGE